VSDDELVARINMGDSKFSFQEKGKVYHPAWIAPEVGVNSITLVPRESLSYYLDSS